MFFKLLLFSILSHSLTEIPLDSDKLFKLSQAAVDALVESKTVFENQGGVWTKYVLRSFSVVYSLDGKSLPERFELSLPGGVMGEVTTYVPGVRSFEVGNRKLFFIERARNSRVAFETEGSSVALVSQLVGLWEVEARSKEMWAVPPIALKISAQPLLRLKEIIPKSVRGEVLAVEVLQ